MNMGGYQDLGKGPGQNVISNKGGNNAGGKGEGGMKSEGDVEVMVEVLVNRVKGFVERR